MSRIARLIEESGAIKQGTFELSNGSQSAYYIDKYVLETDPEILGAIADEITARLEGSDVDVIAGPELGAVPLVTAVSLTTGIPAAFIRKGTKDHGTQERIEGTIETGMRIAIVEDVTTTGSTLLETVKLVEEIGADIARVIVVADRNADAVDKVREAGYELEYLVRVGENLDVDTRQPN